MLSDLQTRLRLVRECLQQAGSVLVAYSGGVDSTLLLRLCRDTLGDHALAVTVVSPVYKSHELTAATDIARSLSVRHLVVDVDPLSDPRFTANPPDRCYYCKTGMLRRLKAIGAEHGISQILDGSNFDDLGDYRPGTKAAEEAGVRSPLQEAGLTKQEIRNLARELDLRNWDKPSDPCLASRFPCGVPITETALRLVERAEDFLHDMSIRQVRVRHYGELAKIEVDPQDISLLIDESRRSEIVARLKDLGYHQITLDLEGYRPGNVNEGHAVEHRSA